MPCEILIAAEDKNHSKKGYPKQVKDVPASPPVWGKKEGPPGYVILRITDARKDQVEHFLEQWHKTFVYEIVNENDQGYRIKVTVDPALVSVSNVNKTIRANLKTYIQNVFGAVIHSYDDYEVVVDVPKPITSKPGTEWEMVLTLQELKEDIHDKFAEVIDHRFYYFEGTDVDYALTEPGGIVEKTKAQVLDMVRSKLED